MTLSHGTESKYGCRQSFTAPAQHTDLGHTALSRNTDVDSHLLHLRNTPTWVTVKKTKKREKRVLKTGVGSIKVIENGADR